jgi:hypothetical protein
MSDTRGSEADLMAGLMSDLCDASRGLDELRKRSEVGHVD